MKLTGLCSKIILSALPQTWHRRLKALKRTYSKTINSELRVSFLEKCVKLRVIPKFLRFKLPRHLRTVSSNIQQCQLKALRKSLTKAKKENLRKTEDLRAANLSLSSEERRVLQPILQLHAQTHAQSVSQRHQKKLALLLSNQQESDIDSSISDTSENFPDSVINLSDINLTDNERIALSLGFSMSWPMEKFDLTAAKTEAEMVFTKLKRMQAFPSDKEFEVIGKLRSSFKSYFKNSKRNFNKFKPFLKALRLFAKNQNLYVSKFDKGNGIVVDKKENYVKKMTDLLSDDSKFKSYTASNRSDKNPFILVEDQLNRSLLRLRNAGDLTNDVYQKIRSVGSQPARLYGLPKIHKNRLDPPYRPVLSMCNSYVTNLSVFLDNLLKPFIPTQYTLKDSFDFADKIKALNMPDNGIFVSYDVCSLFTSVPVECTIDHILSIVDENILPFSKQTLQNLLRLACTNILFTFDDKLFIQHDGVCMGSVLGPTMASFAMDLIESKFSLYQGQLPSVYFRYVDDCFAVFTSLADAESFLDFLNSQHSSLKFTIEIENNESLRFLDTLIKHKNGTIEVEWCLKNTNTGIYIPSCSYAPFRYKTAAMRALFFRAKRISSDHLYSKAADQIISVFLKNGFSKQLILQVKQQVESQITSVQNQNQSVNQKAVYWKLPYREENEKLMTQKLKSVNKLLDVKIKPAYRTFKTAHIFKNKDPVPPGLASNLVYQYQCDRCPGRYIGETRRHLDTRINEHLFGKPVPSEVTLHTHTLKKENFKIITRTPYPRLAETICLDFFKNSSLLNERESSVPLNLRL